MDKAKKLWLDQLRAALIDAAGAAVCAGLIDTAHQINALALDIEHDACYTDTRQRRQARKYEEEKAMKIHFTRCVGEITGAQVVRDDGKRFELETDGEKCGLWVNGKQVIGTCDFDLCCTEATARKRLTEQANFRCRRAEDWSEEEKIETSRTPLF